MVLDSKMNKVKVGIIGIGNMGLAHLSCIYNGEISGMHLVAVCDIDSRRLEDIREKYKELKYYSSSDELIEKSGVDAVIIATPHRFHADISKKALVKGIHVLVEKPIDISVTKVRELNKTAQESNRIFGIMFNQRTNELFQKARDIIKSGELGEIKRSIWIITNWYRTQHYYDSGDWRATWAGEGGGVLLNQAPHNLDLWQWICGMPESVIGFCDVAKYHNIEVEDDATIIIRYKNGATGTFITSTGEYPGTNRLEITGSKGKVVLEEGKLKFWKLKQNERGVCFNSSESMPHIEMEYREVKQTSVDTAHKGVIQNFTNAILYGDSLLAPGIDGINELTLSNAAYLSQWKGNKEIRLPFNNEEFDRILEKKILDSNYKHKEIIKSQSTEYSSRWRVNW